MSERERDLIRELRLDVESQERWSDDEEIAFPLGEIRAVLAENARLRDRLAALPPSAETLYQYVTDLERERDDARAALAAAEAENAGLREEQRLHHRLLRAAWDELDEAEQHHRWHHEQEDRNVEPREHRLGVLLELADALDGDEGNEHGAAPVSAVLAGCLTYLASLHHRTLTNSKLHAPERISDFHDCPCLPCRKAAATLRILDRHYAALASRPGEEQA